MDLVFGYHAVDSLIRHAPDSVNIVYFQKGQTSRRMKALHELALNQGLKIAEITKTELDKLSSGRHQGLIADVDPDKSARNFIDETGLFLLVKKTPNPLLLALDGVTDPQNLGACLRSADAAGVTAVILPKDKSADVNDVAKKVACGAAETVPITRVTNLVRTLDALKRRGIWIFGAANQATNNLYQQDFTLPCVLVLGSEGSGMRRLTRETCDYLVSLPMLGRVSSLNVAVAGGIFLYEVMRQRTACFKIRE